MAALVRSCSLFHLRKSLIPQVSNQLRLISTSKKNSETASASTAVTDSTETKKNWVSYGFEAHDEQADSDAHHGTFFVAVSLCLVVGGFAWAYMPDAHSRGWASRQAFLELRRREAEGLPLIDRNYIDPALIVLPSEEELGDTEIII